VPYGLYLKMLWPARLAFYAHSGSLLSRYGNGFYPRWSALVVTFRRRGYLPCRIGWKKRASTSSGHWNCPGHCRSKIQPHLSQT